MSSTLRSLLPTLLVTSPLLLGAAPSAVPGGMQQSCAEPMTLQNTTSHIAHPIQPAQRALVTTRREWMSLDAGPVQTQCNIKEEPGGELEEDFSENIEEENPAQLDDADGQQIPELGPSPSPAATEAPESTDSMAPSSAATPIPTRTVAPPVSDEILDPGNFTPTDEASPTPFDGSFVPTLESLPDGSYRYLKGSFEYGNYTSEQLTANGGAVFLLTKIGNEVTGHLFDTFGQPGVCITGRLSGNTITGAAYPSAEENMDNPESVGDSFVAYGSGGLQVRQPQTVGDNAATSAAPLTYYADALLDLNNFSRINAGTSLAPTACNVPSADDLSDESVTSN